ncbi:MAG: FAD-binding protein, partial [Bifidobacterium sp.]|nr:FAD-binding protein [Bifidobacterium sp.]
PNPAVATADGLAAAWRAGAQVADVEFCQFHPTAMAVGEHFLVSEAVRGEGAVLLDEHGERYMTRVDERAELAPRDVVARENFRVMQAQGGKPVMLDVSPMRRENPDLAEFLRHRFPTIDAYTRSLGFDWSKEPIPVAPAAHYYMGGIRTDLEGRASIPGLYAAGECARTGVMGSNRLASNSLLEGLVYGRRAGLAAVNDPAGSVWNPVWFSNSATGRIVSDTPVELSMPAPDERAGANGRPAIWDRTRIQNTMWAGVGVLRDGDGLRQAIDQLGTGLALADADATEPAATACEPDPITRLENRNLLTVGYVEANAALRRTESRGAHARTDYPESCDEWAQSIAYINA